MKLKSTLLLAVPLLFLGLSLAQAQVSIQLVSTFHYTYENNGFFPGQINDSDILVGSIITTDGDAEAFYGRVEGRFSAPFHVPDDTVGFTTASGINNHRVLCGRYDGSDFTTKGYVRIGDNYITYVVPLGQSVTATTVDSINDANNFVGGYILNHSTVGVYANLGGVFTQLSSVPGEFPEAHGINNLNQIVGVYDGDAIHGIYHGYLVDSDLSVTSFDFPGARATNPNAINDAGYIVGSWTEGNNKTHGFVIQLPSTFISYDVAGAASTQITGINNNGKMCGLFTEHSKTHGFIAQLVTE